MVSGTDMAKIPVVDYYLDPLVFFADFPQNRHRLIGGAVVDEDDLIGVGGQLRGHYPRHPLPQLTDIFFLVVTSGYDTDEGHNRGSRKNLRVQWLAGLSCVGILAHSCSTGAHAGARFSGTA